MTVVSIVNPLDAVKSDFFTIVFEVASSDISKVESSLGFSLSDGSTAQLKSKISPSHPWFVSVSNVSSSKVSRITISAKQPH